MMANTGKTTHYEQVVQNLAPTVGEGKADYDGQGRSRYLPPRNSLKSR